tara:strand:- start:954 stop:1067 length:114 start_codon:yes stop_codon:yes gene_type:complete
MISLSDMLPPLENINGTFQQINNTTSNSKKILDQDER